MINPSATEMPCPCLSNHEMDNGQSCVYLCDGKCRFFDGSDEENHVFDAAENREAIGPGLMVAVPFTYSPQVFETISAFVRVHLIPLYDRFIAYGEEDFWDVLEHIYDLKAANYGYTSMQIPSGNLEEEYEIYQYNQRRQRGECVTLTNGHCRFLRVIFDHGIYPAPFPGFELYMKNGRPITEWETRDLVDEMSWPDTPGIWVGPLGYKSCPVTLTDIFRQQIRHGCFDRETYKKMVGLDDWDSDESDEYMDI